MSTEAEYYHALAVSMGGEYHTLAKLFAQHKSWRRSYETKIGKRTTPRPLADSLAQSGIYLLLADDPEFPTLLREIPWPPHALYYRGTLPKQQLIVAVVGTRKATPGGLLIAEQFAQSLSSRGLGIASGLAFGIDVAAHKATLKAGGYAIAVLAGGLDGITPRTNAMVGEEIIKRGGCLLSEYPPGVAPMPRRFIERNRIVSGLSQGILVIEAPKRSGTLSTARFATEQNRDVFVVPGGITQINYVGSNELIKNGAQLVTTPEDIVEALGIATPVAHAQPLPFLDSVEQRIVDIVSAAGHALTVDAIAEQSQLGATVINEALALLVIEGVLTEGPAGYQRTTF